MNNVEAMLSDPDWAKSIENQDDWVDTSRAMMSIGHVTPYLMDNGQVANIPKMK